MNAVLAWLRLDLVRRRRSLVVLTVLVAIASGTVMAALAGARRGASALDRLAADTLPATSAVLANTPGFDWEPVRRLPNVEALTLFSLDYLTRTEPLAPGEIMFPPADPSWGFAIERPVLLAGRFPDPGREDEAFVTPRYADQQGKGLGDVVTFRLASPEQATAGRILPGQAPAGPVVRARIVGIGRSPWMSDNPGTHGSVWPSYGVFDHHRESFLGAGDEPTGILNALVRLRGGEGDVAQFRRDFAAATGRADIDIWNFPALTRDAQRHVRFDSDALAASGLAALVAALFLVGQAIVRYAASSAVELQTMRALGMTRLQALATAVAGPLIAGVTGAAAGTALAWAASGWLPYGVVGGFEPRPGRDVDPLVLGLGLLLVPLLVLAGAAAAAVLALRPDRRPAARRSAVALAAARLGLPVPVVVGSRFALERGRGPSAVPIRPALFGSVVGVLGVIGAFTFSSGVADATRNPERFGQTFQLASFVGFNGQDFGPVDAIVAAALAEPQVSAVNEFRVGVAQAPGGLADVSLYTYHPRGRPLPVVLTEGRMAQDGSEVVIAPKTVQQTGLATGDRIGLTGSRGTVELTVSGVGFVPQGSHNDYATGGWLTPAGYDRLFDGFKNHGVLVGVRPGADLDAVRVALDRRVSQQVPDAGPSFEAVPEVIEAVVLRESRVVPLMLGGFLALLALGAVGHALATAVRRRGHDVAVLRAVGMTRRQARGVVITQASLLAGVGLLFGVPLGLALGRTLWRVVAEYTPVDYLAPVAVLALLLVGPLAVLAANTLAAWPGRRLSRARIAHVLRAE